MFRYSSRNTGLIRTIILVVIALLILSYFGFNLRELADSDATQDNFGYVKTFVLNVWNNYLKRPALYLWNDIFLDLIWEPAIENLRNMKDAQPSTLQQQAPALPTPPPVR